MFETYLIIVAVTYGDISQLIDGKWVVVEKDARSETTLMTFNKCFNTDEEALKFAETPAFKTIFNAVSRNHKRLI